MIKLSASANNLNKKDLHLDLHNFKMNISRTLNSNFLKKFHDLTNHHDLDNTKKIENLKFRNRLSSIPTIPVKVTNNYISINPSPLFTSDIDIDINSKKICKNPEFVKSKCQSPFLLRRSIQSEDSIDLNILPINDNYSNISSNVSTLRVKDCNQSDSGLSSLNSAQLFFSEIKEVLNKSKRDGSVKSNSNHSNNQSIRSNRFNSILRNLLSKKSNTDKYLSSPSLLSITKLDDGLKMQNNLGDNANLEALEYLLQIKREDNIPIHQIVDQDGNTLLHKAIIYNQYDIVRFLIKNHAILINCKNNFDLYPIHLCVLKGDMPILRLIARESKKHINKRDATDMTPAMHAAIEGKYEALKYLLDNANAKYNKVTKKERFTLLHLGVQSGSLDVVQYLLFKMGLSYLKCRTKEGATAYHIAAARGHDQILEYLLAIKSSKYLKNLKDITGSTPAHDAAENGKFYLNKF
ncbi:unnamed protein product [Brachionus calyciflorus]|uniref:Uncharacterized protein n=1 Tax=Brachionus calyciflorus TaxID=104777 RepID=A0A813PGJ3_9BILA|nr:unnamed protein product [Brachionus calyciflorus]